MRYPPMCVRQDNANLAADLVHPQRVWQDVLDRSRTPWSQAAKDAADCDGNGVLSRDELETVTYHRARAVGYSEEVAQQRLSALGEKADHALSYSRIIAEREAGERNDAVRAGVLFGGIAASSMCIGIAASIIASPAGVVLLVLGLLAALATPIALTVLSNQRSESIRSAGQTAEESAQALAEQYRAELDALLRKPVAPPAADATPKPLALPPPRNRGNE